MLRLIRVAIRKAYGDDLLPVERWCLRNAGKCSPDEIIAAAIMQSIAKDFDDWSVEIGTAKIPNGAVNKIKSKDDAGRSFLDWKLNGYCFKNSKLAIELVAGYYFAARDRDNRSPWFVTNNQEPIVNGVAFSPYLSNEICKAYKVLKKKRDIAATSVVRAKAEMDRNEAAWNIAERLLGMKRNEQGALVPVQTLKETACSPSTDSTSSTDTTVSPKSQRRRSPQRAMSDAGLSTDNRRTRSSTVSMIALR